MNQAFPIYIWRVHYITSVWICDNWQCLYWLSDIVNIDFETMEYKREVMKLNRLNIDPPMTVIHTKFKYLSEPLVFEEDGNINYV